MTHYDVFMPGAFATFFSGTGVAQGQPYSADPEQERGAKELTVAWTERTIFKRGKGETIGLRLPSIEAAVVLAEYAETCLHVNHGGEMEWSEYRAAEKVLERITEATGGRVAYNGSYVQLDGVRT